MTTTITINIDSSLAVQLAKMSKEQKTSRSKLVEWALEQFLPDPDEGLELQPEVVKRLRKRVNKRHFLSEKEFWLQVLRKK
jgi:metal-responsive CopG/Arc/MetJ family transcriptional regulator